MSLLRDCLSEDEELHIEKRSECVRELFVKRINTSGIPPSSDPDTFTDDLKKKLIVLVWEYESAHGKDYKNIDYSVSAVLSWKESTSWDEKGAISRAPFRFVTKENTAPPA